MKRCNWKRIAISLCLTLCMVFATAPTWGGQKEVDRQGILKTEVTGGKWLYGPYLYERGKGAIVTPYGADKVSVAFQVEENLEVRLEGKSQPKSEENYTVALKASPEGTVNHIAVVKAGVVVKEYEITCFSQKYDDMPDAVIECLCPGSQYTDGLDSRNGNTLLSTRVCFHSPSMHCISIRAIYSSSLDIANSFKPIS